MQFQILGSTGPLLLIRAGYRVLILVLNKSVKFLSTHRIRRPLQEHLLMERGDFFEQPRKLKMNKLILALIGGLFAASAFAQAAAPAATPAPVAPAVAAAKPASDAKADKAAAAKKAKEEKAAAAAAKKEAAKKAKEEKAAVAASKKESAKK
jgi:hypothetical protein